MKRKIGILAYGSLIEDPGEELRAAQEREPVSVTTPFKVEFARSSANRGGAPTLVPADEGGAAVPARVLILHDWVDEPTARAMLWRRETGRTGLPPYDTSRTDLGPNRVRIVRLENFADVDVVLYAQLGANIRPLNPQRLAELAIASALSSHVPKGQDGIGYLRTRLRNGVRTPLSDLYATEVERQIGCGLVVLGYWPLRFPPLQ
ncbi:MAG: hypothetical protein JO110_27845 [Acetobacteraceae bacterium]|nr:hypothetical protein [Acetobacteraceae bacterium]